MLFSLPWLFRPLMCFSIYRQSKQGKLKSRLLFEQSVALSYLSCLCYTPGWMVTAESHHRRGQRFVECNMQSPNNIYTFSFLVCLRPSLAALKLSHPGSVVSGKGCHIWLPGTHAPQCDHVTLCGVFCSFPIFKWLAVVLLMCSMLFLHCNIQVLDLRESNVGGKNLSRWQ